MRHLVNSLPFDEGDHWSLDRCYRLVREAHDYLAQRGAEAIERAQETEGLASWGSGVKRTQVVLTGGERPDLLASTVEQHNLGEVVNQCATIERLLDVLEWAQEKFHGYEVERCHPTTGSIQVEGKKVTGDNDLVLVGPDRQRARFEISDVASDKDSNGKEKKDLVSLGVLCNAAGDAKFDIGGWPSDRLFLVVSQEFAAHLRRPKRSWLKGPRPHCHYIEDTDEGTTRVFEVKKGEAKEL